MFVVSCNFPEITDTNVNLDDWICFFLGIWGFIDTIPNSIATENSEHFNSFNHKPVWRNFSQNV